MNNNILPTGNIMMAMSLDGFVARKDHTLDWLNKHSIKDEDHGFYAFQDKMDIIVMGSGSFRRFRKGWFYSIPGIVLSNSITQNDIPANIRDNVEVSALEPRALMENLGARGIKHVYVDGGAVVRSFLKARLVQKMQITIIPILISKGIRIFGDTDSDIDLELISAKSFPSGLVDLIYKIKD